jgi:hypothetical protein
MTRYIALSGTEFEYGLNDGIVTIYGKDVRIADLVEFVGRWYIEREVERLNKLEPMAYLNWKVTKSE